MPETSYYESTARRERDRDAAYYSDDDDRSNKTTVRRYKVGRDGVERVEHTERKETRRSSGNLLDIGRSDHVPDRPRSAFEVTETSRRSDRNRDYHTNRDDMRAVEKRRDVIRRDSDDYGGEHRHRVSYEKTKEIDRDWPREHDNYPRVHRHGDRDDQIVVETYSEDRQDDGYGGQVEHWRKETEYYEPAPKAAPPVVIRTRPTEQKIILQESPAPPPVIVPHQQPGVVVIREKDRHHEKNDHRNDEDFYFERRERKEVGPYRGEREDDFVIERYDRRDDRDRSHKQRHHHRDGREYASEGDYSDDDYVIKRTVIRRGTSPSPSPNHRLHLAEGALAGAGIGALLGSRRNNQTGDLPEHRGRKVLAGAALGALGTEVLKRAHSAYNERFGDDNNDDSRARSRSRGGGNRSRSTSRHHSKIKMGLGLAAAAIAAAGAAKYIQSTRIDREERNRGRSLHRYSSGEELNNARSVSRRKSRSRSVAKVAAGTAAVAGLVHHFRSKSRQREGKPRSHSRLRTGAEIAAAGLAGAAAKTLYDRRQDKKEQERERQYSDDGYEDIRPDDYYDSRRGRRSWSRSQSQNRSAPHPEGFARAPYSPLGADRELGLVEYGAQPLYSDPAYPDSNNRHKGYDSATDASDRGDQRHDHRRSRRRGVAEELEESDYADVDESDRKSQRSRSRSRLRNLAAAGAGAAAAAIGIKKYKDRKTREVGSSRDRVTKDNAYDRDYDRDDNGEYDRKKRRDAHRKTRDDDDAYDGYYDDYDNNRPPSPPHASGGAFYPPAPPQGPHLGSTSGLMQHSNLATTDLNEAYPPYDPVDYSGYPPPPGPPPAPATGSGAALSAGRAPKVDSPGDSQHESPPAHLRTPNAEHSRDGNNPIVESRPPPQNGGDHVSFVLPLSQHDAASAASAPSNSGSRNDIVTKRRDLSTSASSDHDTQSDTHLKAVTFAALSPQSSRTLERHHVQVHGELARPVMKKSGTDYDDAAIEVLPDRFDLFGQPLFEDGGKITSHQRCGPLSSFASRHGNFGYNDRKREHGWHVHGQWGVAGSDPDDVERIAENIRGVIDGIGNSRPSGVIGLIGTVIGELAMERHGHGHSFDRTVEDSHGRQLVGRDSGQHGKRKRRNTYDTARDAETRQEFDKSDDRGQRAMSVDYYSGGYRFDRDGYDGHDPRKRRRSRDDHE